ERDQRQHQLQGHRPGVAEAVAVAEPDERRLHEVQAAVVAQHLVRVVGGLVREAHRAGLRDPRDRGHRYATRTISAPGSTWMSITLPGSMTSPSSCRGWVWLASTTTCLAVKRSIRRSGTSARRITRPLT